MLDNVLFLGFADNKIPEFREVSGKEWILFGEDNKFPAHLLYLYNKSSNHNAIINGKVTYILGKGFISNPIVNPNQETLNKVFKKFTTDIELFGGGRFQIVWTMGGSFSLYHIPFQNLRISKDKKGFFHSEDWLNTSKYKPVYIPKFDPDNKVGVQIFSYDEYRPGTKDYPLPGYFGALNDIETDVEISKYNLSVIKNGMFSSKMIVFNTGDPGEEAKRNLEKGFKKKFAGSDNAGNFMMVFNTDPTKAPIVNDLSTTDLDKLFDQLNKTTQSEIFSGHQVTSPMLFGVMEPGKLGGRNEIQDAYEIFKNTYINDKQMAIEEIHSIIAPYFKILPEKIIPVDPLSTLINPIDFKDLLPKEWVFEKLGIDPTKYGILPAQPGGVAPVGMTNENVKNMTGKQNQQLLRTIRQYGKGQITKSAAITLLKTSLGLCDEEITSLLGGDEFDEHFDEHATAEMFSEIGESKDGYTVIKSTGYDSFADLTQVDSDIINLIGKDKKITPQIIADILKIDELEVTRRITSLTKSGVITPSKNQWGLDTIIERAINPEVIDSRPKPETVDLYVKYSYEVKTGAGKEIIETTRPFCKRLIGLNRFYTRSEIELISQRVGYSVFDRSGGWWGNEPQCRHEWRRNLVVKKKQ